jgi:SAM-dependent methyltransferase
MHSHSHAPRSTLRHRVLSSIHDTELWASYLPRVPAPLVALALLGLVLAVYGLRSLTPGHAVLSGLSLALGVLLILPAAAAGVFVLWRWRRRTATRRLILDAIPWRGDEQVLDVGCGSGLMVNGAARRLTTGTATGLDLWRPHSGGGSLALLLRNARAEGVAERVVFKDGDARQMPFADSAFDVVLSSGAVHHIINDRAEFDQLLREMARVLKPGGYLAIWDSLHLVQAAAQRLVDAGLAAEVKPLGKYLSYDVAIVMGRK